MTEKLNFLKEKLSEMETVLKNNTSAYKELLENIKISNENKEKLEANILKLQGVVEGLQFSISQIETVSSEKKEEVEKKKGK